MRGSLFSIRTTVIGLLLALLAAGGILAVWQWRQPAIPTLPDVDLADADPAVKSLIASAQAAVRRAPRSADAWGRLGMVLAAHSFYPESVVCFASAQRFDPEEPRWPYFQGVVLTLDDPDAAIAQLRRGEALCANGSDAPRLRLAEVLLGQSQAGEAEGRLREVQDREARAGCR